MTDLPEFTKNAKCPKCFNGDVAMEYLHQGHFSVQRGREWNIEHLPERMLRTCTRCGYNWHEQLPRPVVLGQPMTASEVVLNREMYRGKSVNGSSWTELADDLVRFVLDYDDEPETEVRDGIVCILHKRGFA